MKKMTPADVLFGISAVCSAAESGAVEADAILVRLGQSDARL